MANVKNIKAPALRQGSKVGLLAPASSFSRDLYFAGTAERRTREINELWQRDDIAALICVRGGYGSNYLLDQLNYQQIAAKPKILIGCSDITSLLTAITDRTGLVTFHGPMVAKDIAGQTLDLASWKNSLHGETTWNVTTNGVEILRTGQAEGRLYGGCLSMLVTSLGTPYEIQTEDTILFIEDIGERPFRIDRMLMHLKLAGKFEKVRGFVFGEMLDCLPPKGESYTLQQVIMRILEPYNVPIVYGLKSGHVTSGNITLPLGVRAQLAAESQIQLKILQAATSIV